MLRTRVQTLYRVPDNLFSLVPLFVFYVHTYWLFIHSDDPNIGVIPNLALQQAVIGYSLILATIPCIRCIVRRFTGAAKSPNGKVGPATMWTQAWDEAWDQKHAGTTDIDTLITRTNTAVRKVQSVFLPHQKRPNAAQKHDPLPDVENENWARMCRGSIASPDDIADFANMPGTEKIHGIEIESTETPFQLVVTPCERNDSTAYNHPKCVSSIFDSPDLEKSLPADQAADLRRQSLTPQFDYISRMDKR